MGLVTPTAKGGEAIGPDLNITFTFNVTFEEAMARSMTNSPTGFRVAPPNGHYKTTDIDLATALFASGIRPMDYTESEPNPTGRDMLTVFIFPRSEADLANIIARYTKYQLQVECHRFSQCRRSLLRLAHGGRL